MRGALAAVVLVLTAGCGGATFEYGTDGGPTPSPDGGPAPDGGGLPDGSSPDGQPPPSWSPVCPESQPAIGSACSPEQLMCEYGAFDPDPACVTLVQCESGAWANQSFYGQCPDPGPNSAACAPTFASVPRGQTCSAQGTECRYAQGDCRCEVQFFGGPVPVYDGGYPSPKWDCDDPGPGCPEPRARVGSACATEGQTCSYRPCSLEEQCTNGVWQAPPIACAVPGGAP
jgi:hypothetical protein